jgi:tetratricopeptide (TPR) repeat protein
MKLYPRALLAGALLSFAAGHAALLLGQNQAPAGAFPSPSTASADAGQADEQQEVIAPELSAAEDKMGRQDLDGARPEVEQYLSKHPGDARALFDLGYVEEAAGHDDAAVAKYLQAIAANPRQFESRLALGLLLARQGKQDDAREQLQQAAVLAASAPSPEARAQAFRGLAEVDRTADPEAARDALIAALQISPETSADLLLAAQIAETAGDVETAEEAYRRLLAKLPESGGPMASEATSGLAQILLKEQKYGDSEALLRAALAHDPDEPALNAQLAVALIAQGKNQEALALLDKVRDEEPRNAAVNQMLADAYAQSGHPEKADPIYAAMVQAQPDDPVLLGEQGKNLILEGRYDQAQKALERAVALKPGDGEAWSELAFAASENKQYSTALKALSMRAKYLPETPASYFLKATLYDKLHDITAARETYRSFLAAAAGQFPDQEQQARQRLVALARSR